MSSLWFMGTSACSATGGGQSPDPVTPADASWTWTVDYVTNSKQVTYARATMNFFMNVEDAYYNTGIVSYVKRDSKGIDHRHMVGKSDPDGIVPFINDTSVVEVTFGWVVSSGGDYSMASASNIMEIWVS